jgi:outer membrane biosynthesis protein TonB
MALEYRYQPRDGGSSVDTVKVDQHWYLTEDKDRVVPEGNPAARWLWATPGMDVPRAEAERLGAVAVEDTEEVVEEPAPEPAEEPAETVKEKPAPPNKQQTKPDTKAATPADVPALRKQAEKAGVQVDNRWGADRLLKEIAAVEAGEG